MEFPKTNPQPLRVLGQSVLPRQDEEFCRIRLAVKSYNEIQIAVL